jgi:glycosyltransferase involved in cell wall biosynthesis
MKILHVDYDRLRSYGVNRISWAEKMRYGLIRNNHYVRSFSDRDVAAFEAPLGIRELGKKKADKRFLEAAAGLDPDLIIIGHSDIISLESIRIIKQRAPHCVVVHCNCDPLFVPSNSDRIAAYATVVDAVFVTTGLRDLRRYEGRGARLYYIPNPVEPAVEVLDNSAKVKSELPIDLLFCSNATNFTERLEVVKTIKDAVDGEMNFKTYGSFGEAPIWGKDYDRALSETRMALNLNRQEGDDWYTSDRMAQLGGNGVLQFAHSSGRFDEFIPAETLVYFDDAQDLVAKIREFHHDDDKRRDWAGRAREFFQREFTSALYASYIIEAATMQSFSHDYVWAQNINPDGSDK